MWTTALISTIGLALSCLPARADDGSKYDPRVAFAETDFNRDGVIDLAEFQERITYVFYRADSNKDGFLDATELKRLAFPEDFTDDDKDKDGRVSMREFMRVRFHDFQVADTNDDEVLSLDEVVAAFEVKRQK